jgi:hypothetical protein
MIYTSQFTPYIAPHVPNVSQIALEFMARLAAREFCERTRCWRMNLSVEVTTNEFAIEVPDYAEIHRVERANWGPIDLAVTQFNDLPADWRLATPAPPKWLSQAEWGRFILFPFEPGTLSVSVFLKPKAGHDYTRSGVMLQDYFNQVPDFMLDQFAEPIGSGAVARLLLLPERPWTDPSGAAIHAARFEDACNTHFTANLRGQTRARGRTRYNDF